MPSRYFTCSPSGYLLLTYASVSEVDITDLANDTGTIGLMKGSRQESKEEERWEADSLSHSG